MISFTSVVAQCNLFVPIMALDALIVKLRDVLARKLGDDLEVEPLYFRSSRRHQLSAESPRDKMSRRANGGPRGVFG